MAPQVATATQYIQPCPKAVETDQASKKHCPSFTKSPTSLAHSCTATRALHLPIDDALKWTGLITSWSTQTFLSDVCPKHQQCGVGQDAPKVYLCPWGCPASAYSWGVFNWGHNTALTHAHSHYPKLGVWCPWVGQDQLWTTWTCISPVAKAILCTLATFHGVYASLRPACSQFLSSLLPCLDADCSTTINHFFIQLCYISITSINQSSHLINGNSWYINVKIEIKMNQLLQLVHHLYMSPVYLVMQYGCQRTERPPCIAYILWDLKFCTPCPCEVGDKLSKWPLSMAYLPSPKIVSPNKAQ